MAGLLLENISHAFDGVLAVNKVTLSVGAGEVVCLLGPSGCGKSTTLRLAAGLERLQQGRVLIDDRVMADSVRSMPPEERHVGLMFQDYALFPHLTVLDNAAFGIKGTPAARRARARAILERVGLGRHAESYPHMLSGGEQQRVALARALAPEPGLMLLDEPFSGLDLRLRDRVRDDTLRLLKDAGTATLLVTHDPEEAMRMADRIAVMREGRIEQEGPPGDVYHRPASAFVARFFSEINEMTGRIEGGAVLTPFGRLPADGLGEGTEVDILFRPEAVRLSNTGTAAAVVEARSLGAYGLLQLAPEGWSTRVIARIGAGPIPVVGSRICVSLEADSTFIFARNGPYP